MLLNLATGIILTCIAGAATTPPGAGNERDATGPAVEKSVRKGRTAIFDEVWSQLSTHDAFFDPKSPENRALRKEFRSRIAATDDPVERRRLLVRALSRIKDGHLALTTRWFLPDKPPPPLPLAGDAPMYRPGLWLAGFHRDYYGQIEFPDEKGADGKGRTELCRLVLIDDAPLDTGGNAWSLLNGPQDTDVALVFARPDGSRVTRSFRRTEAVQPPTHWAPTSQRAVPQAEPGKPRMETVEVVIDSRRLEDNLGYIRIEHLVTTQVVTDFNLALDRLMDTDGLILDLRDTGGGYPWIMVPIVGRFFDKPQKVCSFDGRSPTIGTLVRSVGQLGIPPAGKTYDKPLVVLINENTGSMSEGLTFSLGDTGRGLLVGRPTMGLNAAIRNTTLSDGTVLWHSWIRVNRRNGEHYQNLGVQPHERVEVSEDEMRRLGISEARSLEYERQFETALQRLKEKVAERAKP